MYLIGRERSETKEQIERGGRERERERDRETERESKIPKNKHLFQN